MEVYMKKVPDLSEDKSSCCGCGVCAVLCPKNAITMQSDVEGFMYPFIDETKCVICNKCITVCSFKRDVSAKVTIQNGRNS